MRADKKARDGELRFVLFRDAGDCLTLDGVEEGAVLALLREEGCGA